MESAGTLAHRIVPHLNTKGVLVVVDACLVVETLIAQFFSCQGGYKEIYYREEIHCVISQPLTFGATLYQSELHGVVAFAAAGLRLLVAGHVQQLDVTLQLVARCSNIFPLSCNAQSQFALTIKPSIKECKLNECQAVKMNRKSVRIIH